MNDPHISIDDKDLLPIYTWIRGYIRMKCYKTIPPNVQDLMATSLALFVQDSVEKFRKGQEEHGGDIRDRDLDKELRQETLDTFWYTAAKQWPKYL